MPGPLLSTSIPFIHLICTIFSLTGCYCYLHFMDEEMEKSRGPKSQFLS